MTGALWEAVDAADAEVDLTDALDSLRAGRWTLRVLRADRDERSAFVRELRERGTQIPGLDELLGTIVGAIDVIGAVAASPAQFDAERHVRGEVGRGALVVLVDQADRGAEPTVIATPSSDGSFVTLSGRTAAPPRWEATDGILVEASDGFTYFVHTFRPGVRATADPAAVELAEVAITERFRLPTRVRVRGARRSTG